MPGLQSFIRGIHTCRWGLLSTRLKLIHHSEVKSIASNSTLSTGNSRDKICPPDPESKLCHVKFAINPQETKLEKEYRELQQHTQSWNQQYWAAHNKKFVTSKESFVEKFKQENSNNDAPVAEELNEFYTQFLKESYQLHTAYNKEWYKKNFKLLCLALKVNMQQTFVSGK